MELSQARCAELLQKIAEAQGFDSIDDFLTSSEVLDAVSPAICAESLLICEMEPDQTRGYCEGCGQNTVVAALKSAAMPKVTFYVVQAFDLNDDGELIGRAPQSVSSASLAKRTADALAKSVAGVIAWSRDGDAAIGEYGEPTILFKTGLLPDDLD